jgi:hypothetical protein
VLYILTLMAHIFLFRMYYIGALQPRGACMVKPAGTAFAHRRGRAYEPVHAGDDCAHPAPTLLYAILNDTESTMESIPLQPTSVRVFSHKLFLRGLIGSAEVRQFVAVGEDTNIRG